MLPPGSQGNESTLRTSRAAVHSAEPLPYPAPLCPVQRCGTTPCRCLPAGSSNTAFASWFWKLLEGFWLCRSLVWSEKAVKRSQCARCPSRDHPRARWCILRAESGTSVLSVSKPSSPGRKAERFCAGAHCAEQGGSRKHNKFLPGGGCADHLRGLFLLTTALFLLQLSGKLTAQDDAALLGCCRSTSRLL